MSFLKNIVNSQLITYVERGNSTKIIRNFLYQVLGLHGWGIVLRKLQRGINGGSEIISDEGKPVWWTDCSDIYLHL